MSDCLTQNISNNSNESVEKSVVKSAMDSVTQQTPQTTQQSQQQQSSTTQLLIGQQMSSIVTPIDVSPQNQNSVNDSSANSSVSVSMNSTVISSNVSEAQNTMSSTPNLTVTSSAPSVSTPMSVQGSVQPTNTQSPQLIVSSSQPQLAPASQTAHLNASGLMHQSLNATITSMANHSMQMTAQTAQHNQLQPLLQTSVQPSNANQMSVTMSQLPQMQVIQQQLGAAAGTYQLQQVYPQGMLLPGNLTIQNMNFQNQGLSLQIPFTGHGGVNTGTMPITSIAAKPPIMSKGVAISPLTHSQHHMISPLKPNMNAQSHQQLIKQVLPQQFLPHSSTNQTVVISQLLPQQNQHSIQQSILPANANKALLEAQKGKPFGTASFRSAFGNKMLSHSAAIQPKSSILPATSMSSVLTNSQFKTPFHTNANTTQLIATQNGSNLLTNPQILGSFQTIGPGITWASPQSTHLVTPNGSPIFIRAPGQGGEHMLISTSNMSSPHIQTVSMAAPMSVHNSVHTPIQMSSASTQSAIAPAPLQSTTFQTLSVTSNANSTTMTTPIFTSQSMATGPISAAPIANKTKILRQISSVATQTASPASAQKVESTTNLKPIAPAKPKPSAQQLSNNNKQLNQNSTSVRSTSVGTTQTINQTATSSAQVRPTPNKSDASNQTHKISVATETPKPNNSQHLQQQVSSSRVISDQTRQLSGKNSNTSESSESKVNISSEPMKTQTKRPAVEKKDASTEQDMDLTTNLFVQNNHKLVQNSVQTTTLMPTNMSQPNGQIPVLSDLNRQDLSKQPQKAIVKPQKSQILTHVIDGYIIKESANPFPVNGLSYSSDPRILNEEKTNNNSIESLKLKNKNENSLNSNPSSSKKPNSEKHLCLNCGAKRKANSKNNRALKRFCSQTCSEKFTSTNKSANSPRLLLFNQVTGPPEDTDLQRGPDLAVESITDIHKQNIEERKKCKISKKVSENIIEMNGTKNGDLAISSEPITQKTAPIATEAVPPVICVPTNTNINEESTNSAIAGLYIPPGGRNPLQWTVNDVYEFVRNLQGCTEYADEFRSQEIDGQALMLIKEDHLMNTMNMKLGPALKICSKINALREDVQKQS